MPMEQSSWYSHTSPEVSLVILNYNKADLTGECLRHLIENTAGRTYEIVVVDNGSEPAQFRKLADLLGGEPL